MYSVKDFIDYNIISIKTKEEGSIRENLGQDDITKQEDLLPKRPFEQFENEYLRGREMELMRNLYSTINSYLYPFIVSVLNEYEYEGSPIYNVRGIDRETLAQMLDRVLDVLEESIDQVGEIREEEIIKYLGGWDRLNLLRSNIDSLLLTEIFTQRRPEYFKI